MLPSVLAAVAGYAIGVTLLPELLAFVSGLRPEDMLDRTTRSHYGASGPLWANVIHLISQKPWTGWGWGEPSGTVVDASPTAEAPAWPAAAVLTEALARFADPAAAAEAPGDLAGVMAMAQAALLSARTGQAESPTTIRRMVGIA